MIQNKILVGLAALLLVGMMSVFSVSQTEKAIKFRLGEIHVFRQWMQSLSDS